MNLQEDKLIGIMSVVHEGRKPFGKQTYFFEDMVKNADCDEHQIFFFSPIEWRVGIHEVSGYMFVTNEWIEAKCAIPQLIYDRAFSKDEHQKLHLESFRSFLRDSETTILNPFALADLLNNKTAFHKFLLAHNIPTLDTFPFSAIKSSNLFDSKKDTQYYLKPNFGSKGEGIFVIDKKENTYWLYDQFGDKESFSTYTNLLEKLDSEIEDSDRYFIQEAAKTEQFDSAPFDIRVLVQNYGNDYQVTGMAVRIGQKNSTTSNLNSGGYALPFEDLDDFLQSNYMQSAKNLRLKVEKLCLVCSEVLRNEIGEFCEIGFDILITKDNGPIIIEGNAKPSRWVFVKIADYLEKEGRDNSLFLSRRKETVSVPIKYGLYLLNK